MTGTDSGKTVVAVPVANGLLCAHFGHCQQFEVFEVDKQSGQIEGSKSLDPPPHEPGLLPRWLSGEGVDLVIAGGIGQRARGIFSDVGMELVAGAPAKEPRQVVQDYLDGQLAVEQNPCDH